MTPVKIIFAGLIVLSGENGIPPRNGIRVESSNDTVSAYLLSNADHVPLLLIYRGDVDASTPGPTCAMVSDAGYDEGDCDDLDYDHFMWSLAGFDLELDQRPSLLRYLNGSREAGGNDHHFKQKKPSEISPPSTLHNYDVTWIPEMKKIIGIEKLKRNFQEDVTSAVSELQGEIVPILWNDEPWYWAEQSSGKYETPTGKQYDQVFAHKVEMGIELRSLEIKLKPREGNAADEVLIKLKGPTYLYVYNLPNGSGLERKEVNGEMVCVAKHFEHFYDVLETKPSKARVPYIRSDSCELKQTYVARFQPSRLTTDSFCPPVITVKPPG